MKILPDLKKLPNFRNAVITIGSFDGVHPGHRHIIDQMRKKANDIDGETLLITFYPHPRIALAAQNGNNTDLKLLCDLDEKSVLLNYSDLDNLVVVPFTKIFSEQSPDEYIEDFLVKYFKPKIIVIGYDHRFGKGRIGDIEYLKKFQQQYNYEVLEISKQEVEGIAVSSTKIRTALNNGEVALAEKLLGYPYSIRGTVVEGKKIGRKLGFPTANIEVNSGDKLIPAVGIYAVLSRVQNKVYKAMLYIGSRPTLDDNLEKTIEVNLFDFDSDIYNCQIKIDFIDYLRDDVKFDSLEELKIQLKHDRLAAQNRLKTFDLNKII